MHTKQRGGAIETDENAVAVIAWGTPVASTVVTIVTPAAKEAIAALKSSAGSTPASLLSRRNAAMQLSQEFVVCRQFGRELCGLLFDGEELLLRGFQRGGAAVADPGHDIRNPAHSTENAVVTT